MSANTPLVSYELALTVRVKKTATNATGAASPTAAATATPSIWELNHTEQGFENENHCFVASNKTTWYIPWYKAKEFSKIPNYFNKLCMAEEKGYGQNRLSGTLVTEKYC